MRRRNFLAAVSVTPVAVLGGAASRAKPVVASQVKVEAGMWPAVITHPGRSSPCVCVESIVNIIRAVDDSGVSIRVTDIPPTHDYMSFLSASRLITMPGKPGRYGDTTKIRVYNAGVVTWNKVFPGVRPNDCAIYRHRNEYQHHEPFAEVSRLVIACGRPSGNIHLRIEPTLGQPMCRVWLARHREEDYAHDKDYNLVVAMPPQSWPLPLQVYAPDGNRPEITWEPPFFMDTFHLTDTVDDAGRIVYRLASPLTASKDE